jgi:hypothetical protein
LIANHPDERTRELPNHADFTERRFSYGTDLNDFIGPAQTTHLGQEFETLRTRQIATHEILL